MAEKLGPQVQHAVGSVHRCDLFTFPAGEWNKTAAQWQGLGESLLAAGLGRDAAIIALGGGVTGDLAGFVAATFMRGIPYVQVPTTLLAMIDSSIGGKTGVDTAQGKNLIGAFHQPKAVIADLDALQTLPPAHLCAGMAEALKHGAIADASYFEWLVSHRDEILHKDRVVLHDVVRRSVEIKADVVAQDVHESGRRMILNFGHTVGHAIEAVAGYEVLHGEAVAAGMAVEARLGARLGITDSDSVDSLIAALGTFRLPDDVSDYAADALLEAMQTDKKRRNGTVRFALLETIGAVARSNTENWTFEASETDIVEALRA